MDKETKKRHCQGCRDNIYNHGGPRGHTRECWSLEEAKIIKRKKVHVSEQPPWDNCPIIEVPNCYHQPKYVLVKPTRRR